MSPDYINKPQPEEGKRTRFTYNSEYNHQVTEEDMILNIDHVVLTTRDFSDLNNSLFPRLRDGFVE